MVTHFLPATLHASRITSTASPINVPEVLSLPTSFRETVNWNTTKLGICSGYTSVIVSIFHACSDIFTSFVFSQ